MIDDLIDKEKLINDSKFIFEISDLEFSLIKNNSLIKFNFYNSKEIEINFSRKKYILSNKSKINLEWFDTIEKFIVFYNNFNNNNNNNNSNNLLSNLNYYFSEFSIQQIEQHLNKNIKNSVKKTLRNILIDSYNKLALTTFGQDNNELYNLKPKKLFQKYFAILISYPVLTRLLFNEINKNINFYSIVFKRVDKDINLISHKFFDSKNIRLINISQPLSDSHNGSYVIKLFFDNGKIIVYKPK
jgi:lantibiotic modifying enzyme